MTQQDVVDWKRHPVTQILFSVFEQRIRDLKEEMVWQAKEDQLALAERAGYIKACYDIQDFRIEEAQDGS